MQIRPPGDKSLTHRALILGALGTGRSTIAEPLVADDTRATASVLETLGIRLSTLGSAAPVDIDGRGLSGLRQPTTRLDCGNSGTAARLLLGVLSGSSVSAVITGDESLQSRPMRRVSEPLRQMGADIEELAGDGLPVLVRGRRLSPLDYEPPVASAQVKGAIMLAGLVGGVPVTVRERVRTRDHTERLLTALGATIDVSGNTVALNAVDELSPFGMHIPGDPSAAAFLVVAALFSSSEDLTVTGVSLNPTRTAFLDVLRQMGADIHTQQTSLQLGEPVGDVTVTAAQLRAVEVPAGMIPWLIDEVPVLAVLASRVEGETIFRGVSELRVKESDRLATITNNLVAIGGEAWVDDDDLHIVGHDRPYSGLVHTATDHRIAMAFATLDVHPSVDLRLSEDRSPHISYPTFFQDLNRLVARG